MKNKFEIFDHYKDTMWQIGVLANYKLLHHKNTAIISGYPAACFNSVILVEKDDALLASLQKQNIPFVCLPTEASLAIFADYLQEQHLSLAAQVHAHGFADLSKWHYSQDPIVSVKKITTLAELEIFDKISAPCFGHGLGYAYQYLQAALFDPSFHFFLASIDNQYAGCGLVSLVNDTAGLYWGGVLPAFRKRGVASALTKFRMHFVKTQGYQAAYAQNLPASIPYFQKIGFEDLGALPIYVFLPAVNV